MTKSYQLKKYKDNIKVGVLRTSNGITDYNGKVYFMSGCSDVSSVGRLVASTHIAGCGNCLVWLFDEKERCIFRPDLAGYSGILKDGVIYDIHKQ